ncbi:MAG: T9SS type A sorting domain-containing protein [Bacteroidetes bacterium]|nr:T9SS type A sorting domain-containing protein [Bacteroidota bacterium]
MKAILTGSFLMLLCISNATAKNGDTLQVTTHNKVVIKTNPAVGNTRYSGWGVFPGESVGVRKLFLDLTFECAPGLKCGEWDYINRILIGKRRGNKRDSLGWEIARYITPYGFYWDASQGWNFKWRIDLTDYAYLLRDSIEVIYEHTGYEGNTDRGWRITLNFTCVQGDPVRPVYDLKQLYQVGAPYGDDAAFDNAVPAKKFTPAANASALKFKIIQTGHGMDKTENCSEFCAKRRTLLLDGSSISESYVWNEDCGSNPLFPQAGTWLYDRAGWCPGAPVREHQVTLESVAQGEKTFKLNMESYAATLGGGGNYSITAYVAEMGPVSKQNDAAIWDILAPSTEKEYGRFNPICGEPVVVIRNMGAQTLTKLKINYGTKGNARSAYIWTGNLPHGASDTVFLPRFFAWGSDPKVFEVNCELPNDKTDEYPLDNQAWSGITYTPTYPDKLIIYFKSNNAPTENSYRILDANNNIIYSKNGFDKTQFIYRDTVQLYNGCFTFIFDDRGTPPSSMPLNEDGLNWWANTADGAGIISLRNGYTGGLVQNFNADFGTDIVKSFTVGSPMGRSETNPAQGLRLYPNPSRGRFMLDITDRIPTGDVRVKVLDMSGRQVWEKVFAAAEGPVFPLNLQQLAAGNYLLEAREGTTVQRIRLIKE